MMRTAPSEMVTVGSALRGLDGREAEAVGAGVIDGCVVRGSFEPVAELPAALVGAGLSPPPQDANNTANRALADSITVRNLCMICTDQSVLRAAALPRRL